MKWRIEWARRQVIIWPEGGLTHYFLPKHTRRLKKFKDLKKCEQAEKYIIEMINKKNIYRKIFKFQNFPTIFKKILSIIMWKFCGKLFEKWCQKLCQKLCGKLCQKYYQKLYPKNNYVKYFWQNRKLKFEVCHTKNILPKIEKYAENRKFCHKLKKNPDENWKFCHKSKILPKIENSANNFKFC